ncbi:MAG: glycosyltransferase family 2 protein [Candidatus Eremiobacteraeota bacterium]|nr:glycosyltransferase family 2 protein [Candidatus Eremiobacteraeota bacterium]
MKEDLYISVVIPAYNEEKRIGSTLDGIIEYFGGKNKSMEIIVVDDGSTDETAKIVNEYAEKHSFIHLIKKEKNEGKALAVKDGVLSAKGEFILFSDADLSTPINELKSLMKPIREEKAGVSIASRAILGSKVETHQPFYREFMGKFFNRLVQFLALPGVFDTQCGFKLFTREAAQDIFPRMTVTNFSFDVEILAIARARDYHIAEVPVRWINSSETKLSILRDVPRMFMGILQVHMNLKSGRYLDKE